MRLTRDALHHHSTQTSSVYTSDAYVVVPQGSIHHVTGCGAPLPALQRSIPTIAGASVLRILGKPICLLG